MFGVWLGAWCVRGSGGSGGGSLWAFQRSSRGGGVWFFDPIETTALMALGILSLAALRAVWCKLWRILNIKKRATVGLSVLWFGVSFLIFAMVI